MELDRIKFMNRRLKQTECDHSAYKMMPIWRGLFGIGWVCTQCGLVKQNLEATK